MTTRRTPDQLIAAFLQEGVDAAPDRTFDAIRRDIHQTRQRAVIGSWGEPSMQTLTRLAIAAAIVVAVGVAWTQLGPRQPSVGGNPSPTASPSPTGQLVTGDTHPLAPGRYYIDYGQVPGATPRFAPQVAFTVPAAGWTNFATFAADKNYGPTDAEAGASFAVWNITNVQVDPCTNHQAVDVAPGPGVPELLQTLAAQKGLTAGPLTAVTVGGHSGSYVELTITTDPSTCPGGFFTWGSQDDGRFAQGKDEVDRVYALDVGGKRLTFFARIPKRTTASDRAELESIIASIGINPNPSASPSASN